MCEGYLSLAAIPTGLTDTIQNRDGVIDISTGVSGAELQEHLGNCNLYLAKMTFKSMVIYSYGVPSKMKSKQMAYYPYFDYLRIVLASVVMFAHDGLISWEYSGKLAVDVFFALSGWLIGGVLIKTKVQDLSRFYFNRALRIWVPYYIALLLIVIASILKDPINMKWFEFITYKLTWVYNIFGPPQLQICRDLMPLDGTGNHFWSVNAEEQFYLLSPLLLVVFSSYGKRLTSWIVIAISFWFMNIYAPITLGVLAAIANNKYPDFHRKKTSKIIILILFISASAGLAFTNEYKFYAPIFAISLVLLIAKRGENNLTGKILGGMSYPLYLNHWIGIFFFNTFLDHFGLKESAARYILSAFMNYAIAAFLYWYIERNIIEMRGKLYTAKRGVIFTIIAYISLIAGLFYGAFLFPSIKIVALLLLFITTASLVIVTILNVHPNGIASKSAVLQK